MEISQLDNGQLLFKWGGKFGYICEDLLAEWEKDFLSNEKTNFGPRKPSRRKIRKVYDKLMSSVLIYEMQSNFKNSIQKLLDGEDSPIEDNASHEEPTDDEIAEITGLVIMKMKLDLAEILNTDADSAREVIFKALN